MQLLIILALLMYAGKSGAKNLIEEVKPVLESIGGESMKEALKSAEEITSVLTAVKEFGGAASDNVQSTDGVSAFWNKSSDGAETQSNSSPSVAFPLKPVSNIADRDIAYSLSKYLQA